MKMITIEHDGGITAMPVESILVVECRKATSEHDLDRVHVSNRWMAVNKVFPNYEEALAYFDDLMGRIIYK
jgi:hypothetical protein